MTRPILCLLVLLSIVACGPHGGGSFTATGYESELYPLEVRYAPGGSHFVSGYWVVDNYSREGSEIGDAKTSREYVTRGRADIDDDGRPENIGQTYRYDLRLRHRENGAVMWIRNLVVSQREAELSLEAFAETYVESSLEADAYGRADTPLIESRFAPGGWGRQGGRIEVTVIDEGPDPVFEVTDRLPMTIDGRDAYGVLVGITAPEVAEVAPDSRLMHAAVVLIRTDYGHEIHGTRGRRELPTILAVGYASRPERFANGMEDFRRLLESLDL